MRKRKIWTVVATLTLRGASMEVEAETEDEAREIAEREPDFDMMVAELSDITITRVRP